MAYVKEYEENNPPYLIYFLDGLSKYLSVYLVKNLKSNSIIPVMNKFFNEDALYKYLRICSDRGVEYLSKPAKKFYEKNKLTWYTTKSEDVKISPVERCIRTIKTKLFRFITPPCTESYHDKLKNIYIFEKSFKIYLNVIIVRRLMSLVIAGINEKGCFALILSLI